MISQFWVNLKMSFKVKDIKQFNQALQDSEHKMNKADSQVYKATYIHEICKILNQVVLLEEQLESTKNRICHVARDTQDNKAIPEELIQKYRVQKSEKEKENK